MNPPKKKTNLVVVGAGAIGLTVTGWLLPHTENLHLLARGESIAAIRKHGLQLCQRGMKPTRLSVSVVESLKEISSPPDIIVLTVKNYDIDRTVHALKSQCEGQPIIVSLQNGVENQLALPKYFTRPLYGVVCYNAWRNRPGKVEYVKRGHIVIGTPSNDLQTELQTARDIFNPGMECEVTDRFRDAVYCKLGINQINALMALVGFRKRSLESDKILVHVTTRLLWEAVQVLQAMGIIEHDLGSLPSWGDIQDAVDIPESPTNPLYDFIVNRVGPTSMTQDVFGGKESTELDSLTGYMLQLARKVNVPMPINQAIYEIAKESFGPHFKPIEETALWEMIHDRIRR